MQRRAQSVIDACFEMDKNNPIISIHDVGAGGLSNALPELVAESPEPITLVVPDGSWRQAAKSTQREPALKSLPRVTLPDMGPTRYRLRHEPKSGGLGTFEAIARALRIIEGEEVYAALDKLFTTMVERTLATRGQPHTP